MTGILASPDISNLRSTDRSVKGMRRAHSEAGAVLSYTLRILIPVAQ